MSNETTNTVNSISPGSLDNSLRAEIAASYGTNNDLNGQVAYLKLKLLQMEHKASSGMICYYFPFFHFTLKGQGQLVEQLGDIVAFLI